MYIRTYKRTYVYYIRLDSFGFGSASYQTKTKPKPNQNHTKTIPQTGTVLVLFLVRFWSRTSIKNEPNLNQKRTKNQTNICVQWSTLCTRMLKPISSIFGSFLVQIWFVFDAGSASKPNQNQTKTEPKPYRFVVWFWYDFGMILVWFWYGFGLVLVWYEADPKPNEYT